MTSGRNRVVINTGVLYAKMGITVFVSLYTTRLVLNSLGASDFGVYALLAGAISMLGFIGASMAAATQRYMSYYEGGERRGQKQSIFNISIRLHAWFALCALVVLVLGGWVLFAVVLNLDPVRVVAAKIVYASLIVATISTIVCAPYDAVVTSRENMLLYALVGVGECVLKVVIASCISIYSGDRLVLFGVLMALVPLASLFSIVLYCMRNYPECRIVAGGDENAVLKNEMLQYAGWSLLGNASGMVTGYGSGVVLNHYFGSVLNSALGVSNQLGGQLQSFSSTMLKALNPVIAKSEGAGERGRMIAASVLGTKMAFALYAVFAIPVIVDTEYILKLWLRVPPLWAVSFCRLILIRILIEQLSATLCVAVAAVGNVRESNAIRSGIVFSELLILIGCFSLGMNPLVMVLLGMVSASLVLLLNVKQANKYCGLDSRSFYYNVVGKLLIVGAISAGVSRAFVCFSDPSLLRLAIMIVTSSATFALIFYVKVLAVSERGAVLSSIKSVCKMFWVKLMHRC